MYKSFTSTKILIICIGIIFLMQSCKQSNANDPFAEIDFYDASLGKRIEDYNTVKNQSSTGSKANTPTLYIDFSDGINQAFQQADVKNKVMGCFNALITESPEVYGLGSQNVLQIQNLNSTTLGQMLNDPATYKDKFAPIQKAVEQIVNQNNDALLITDFEEWQNNSEVTSPAFLTPAFTKWLANGNSIHFFIADYTENNIQKHLYFTIFNYGNHVENSILDKLENVLSSLPRYDLSNQQYHLTTKYATEKSGGIFYDDLGKSENAKNVLDLKDSYINGSKNHYEFYPLGVDWTTISGLKDSYKDQFTNFFRNLFIDLSNENAYTFGDFDVKVYDVSDDFIYFSKCHEAENHKPKTDKDKNNAENKFADDETDQIALGCYNPDGSIKEEWIYKPKELNLLNEVFTLNKELFNNTKNNDKKNTELAVKFHPNFSLKNIPNPDGLLRIDIVLNSANPNTANPILNSFKWSNSKNIENKALYESIITTLQEPSVKPNNKTIYSYYIKTLQ